MLLAQRLARGPSFAAQASAASIAAIAASEAFNFAYAELPRCFSWPLALVAGMSGWVVAALLLMRLPASLVWALAAACVAGRGFPQSGLPRATGACAGHARRLRRPRGGGMLAGALLTLAVTSLAASMGATWSGLLSVFPLLGMVLAVSAQREHGPDFVALLMRGMVVGRGSVRRILRCDRGAAAALWRVVELRVRVGGVHRRARRDAAHAGCKAARARGVA